MKLEVVLLHGSLAGKQQANLGCDLRLTGDLEPSSSSVRLHSRTPTVPAGARGA